MASTIVAGFPAQDDEAEAEEDERRSRILLTEGEEEVPLIIGYPVISETVEGQPVYAFLPSAPLPPLPPPPPYPTLPYSFHRPRRNLRCRSCILTFSCILAFLLLLGGALAFFLWPRSIETSFYSIDIEKIHFSTEKGEPSVSFDLDLDLSIQARNPNFLEFVYEEVVVSVFFQGDEIGEPQESDGGSIEALQTSSVDANLAIDGYQISKNVSILIVDINKGSVPLQITAVFDGSINLFLVHLPVQNIICIKMEILRGKAIVDPPGWI